MAAQNERLLDSTEDKWSPSRQSWETFSKPDDVEGFFSKRPRFGQWCSKAKRRIEPWGFTLAVAVMVILALSGSLVVALRPSHIQPACPTQDDVLKSGANGAGTLYNGQYPIHHDYIGAYITCPLDSPEAARKAGCTFDSLFHGYIPDPCLDHDLYRYWVSDRFGDLEWREGEASRIIPTSDILVGDIAKYPTAWAPTKTHYNHCLYLINGTSRAQARETPLVLDTHLDESHMQHCFDILTNPPEDYPATFLFTYQHRCYIRNLSRINNDSGAFIRKLKSEAAKLVTG